MLDKLFKKLLDLEKKHNLLDFEISNVRIWQACRTFIFYRIEREAGVFTEMHTVKNRKRDRIEAIPSFIKSILFHNPFLDFSRSDVLIFDHSRKVRINGEYIDIYTKYFIDYLKEEGTSLRVYEEPHQNRHYTRKGRERKHLDIVLILSRLYAHFVPLRLSRDEKSRIISLGEEIKKKIGVEIDLLKYFKFEIKKFKAQYALFSVIIRKNVPSRIYCVVAYGRPALIKAARDQGVETVEIQHGTISDFHPGYHYPHTRKGGLGYFPDRIFLWDDFWKRMCSIPLDDDRLEIKGFEFLVRESRKYAGLEKNNHQILVISQGAIGPRLSEMLLAEIERLKQFRIVYKLHPGEYDRWKGYKSLVSLSRHENVVVVDNNSTPLYKLMAESAYIVGVYSTAIFESLYFGCSVVLADLPGIEYMHKFIEMKNIPIWRKKDRLADHLRIR
ncbi:MAG: hypothetical protein AB2L13_18650 [Spirochaetota bacterium]